MLTLTPCTLREASLFVSREHRHHRAPQGGLFAVAVSWGEVVVGVAIVGRPVARMLNDGWTCEVTRLAVTWGASVPLQTIRVRKAFGLGSRRVFWQTLRTAGALDPFEGACSMLYAAAWRAARALGYRALGTYNLRGEGGASLRAAGWRCVGEAGGGSWARRTRPRVDQHPLQRKLRWEVREVFNE